MPPESAPFRRVAYVCDEYPGVTPHFGGIGVVFQTEAEWFAARGFETHVFVQYPGLGPGAKEERGVVIHILPSGKIPKLAAALDRLALARAVASVMRGERGVVVAAEYAALLVTKPFPQPLVVQFHGGSTVNALQRNERPRMLVRALERRELGLATGCRSVSQFTASMTFQALRVRPKNTVVIPNSVDADFFSPGNTLPAPGRILFVGKLNTIKGARVLADVIAPVLERVPGAHFVLIGQDTSEGGKSVRFDMEQRIPARVRDRVTMVGRASRGDVADAYRSSALVVVPSLSEACPMVVLEAMASGRPVVASRRAAIPEFVEEGATGLLADPSDPDTFVDAIVRLLQDPALAERLGRQARESAVRRYSRDAIMGRLLDFYASVAAGDRRLPSDEIRNGSMRNIRMSQQGVPQE